MLWRHKKIRLFLHLHLNCESHLQKATNWLGLKLQSDVGLSVTATEHLKLCCCNLRIYHCSMSGEKWMHTHQVTNALSTNLHPLYRDTNPAGTNKRNWVTRRNIHVKRIVDETKWNKSCVRPVFLSWHKSFAILTVGILINILVAITCMIDLFYKNIAASNFCDDRKLALTLSYPGGGGKIRLPSCFSSTILKRLKVSSWNFLTLKIHF